MHNKSYFCQHARETRFSLSNPVTWLRPLTGSMGKLELQQTSFFRSINQCKLLLHTKHTSTPMLDAPARSSPRQGPSTLPSVQATVQHTSTSAWETSWAPGNCWNQPSTGFRRLRNTSNLSWLSFKAERLLKMFPIGWNYKSIQWGKPGITTRTCQKCLPSLQCCLGEVPTHPAHSKEQEVWGEVLFKLSFPDELLLVGES